MKFTHPTHSSGAGRLQRVRSTIRLSALLLWGFTGALHAAATSDPAEVYKIGVPDLLNITVWEQEELSGNVLVRTDGRISVPLIGDMRAEGRTPDELADAIEVVLSEFVSEPRVDVAVLEMRSQVVSVIGGGIENSGVLELRHNMRILDAIAEMGGFTPFAKKRKIKVLRNTEDGGETELNFDYTSFIKGEAPGSNFMLQPGDTVIVPE